MSVTHDPLGWNCALSNAGPDSGTERVQAGWAMSWEEQVPTLRERLAERNIRDF
jgi:hypothetical protein